MSTVHGQIASGQKASAIYPILIGAVDANMAAQFIQAVNGAAKVTLLSSLNNGYDSVNTYYKGPVTTMLNSISATTTSVTLNNSGYNGVLLYPTVAWSGTPTTTASWTIKIDGSPTSGATAAAVYLANGSAVGLNMLVSAFSANFIQAFYPVPDYLIFEGVLAAGSGNLTLKVQGFNI